MHIWLAGQAPAPSPQAAMTWMFTVCSAKFSSPSTALMRMVRAPSVTLDRKERPGALEGVMRPELLGAAVTIERLGSAGWEQVASAVVGEAGVFVAELDLAPGVYRARIPAIAGLAAGTSRQLTIDAE